MTVAATSAAKGDEVLFHGLSASGTLVAQRISHTLASYTEARNFYGIYIYRVWDHEYKSLSLRFLLLERAWVISSPST